MPFDEALAARVRSLLSHEDGFAEKRMFGGVGFLLDGNMCVGVWKEFLILRLGGDAAEDALTQPGFREFDITGRAMNGWVMAEPAAVRDDDELMHWTERAVRFVRTLPGK